MKTLNNFIIKLIATGFGLGYSPIIPGTLGSLLGVFIFFLLFKLRLSLLTWIIICIFLFFIGVLTATQAERLFSKKDCRKIVIDEIVGCIIFLLFIPHTKWCIIIGFIIYRFLDIVKPFPANRSQALIGGWGITIDDLIVAIYTVIVINIAMIIKGLIC